ncbi:MAG: hypothetical protein K2X66_03565, partial [Cyanobacteria bacterium]|nr:hypothetical protein [Cyanobacteriota bacterium]
MANLSTMSLPSLRVFQGAKTPDTLNLSKRSNAMGLQSGIQPFHPIKNQDTVTLRFGAADALKFQPSLNPFLKSEMTQDAFKKTLNAQLQKVLAQGDATPAFKAEKVALTHQLTEVLDQYLQGIWTDETQPAKKAEALEALKALMGPRGQGNVVMAQINPAPGDLEGNARKIMAYLDMAEKIGVDSVFFPEMSLMGYPIRDIIKRHPFIVKENLKWLQAIAKRTGKTKAYIGFVEPRELPKTAKPTEKPSGKEFYNSVAILGDGKLEGLVRKSLLPTYGEFNDDRTFEASDVTGMLSPDVLGTITPRNTRPEESGKPHTIHGKKWAPFICEDTWNDKDFMSRPYYENDPIEALMQHKPDVLVNLSASPTRSRKEQMKHAMLSYIAEKHQVPYVYVNQVGSIDETSFEGASRVYDQNGQLVARSKSFQEQFMVVNPFKAEGVINPLPIGLEKTLGARKVFNPYDESDLGRTYLTLIQGIRDYFRKNGGFTKAVLGISGGLDSAVVATLLVDALGAE